VGDERLCAVTTEAPLWQYSRRGRIL
jgi:hypothetical protein